MSEKCEELDLRLLEARVDMLTVAWFQRREKALRLRGELAATEAEEENYARLFRESKMAFLLKKQAGLTIEELVRIGLQPELSEKIKGEASK